MRKDRFLEQLYPCMPAMRKALRKFRLDADTVSDIVSDTITSILQNKSYDKIQSDCKAYLCRSVVTHALDYKRQQTQRGKTMMHIADEAELERFYEAEPEPDTETDCPFCHIAKLDERGGCSQCHTILPRRFHRPVEVWSKIEDLSIEFQYEKQADVRKAIARLSPLQQKIVKHVIQGNESLAEFAESIGQEGTKIWREWKKAKTLLTIMLADYSVHKLSKHGQEDLQACLN